MPPRFSRWEKSILASKLQKTGLLGVNADGDLKLKSQCSFTIPKILGLSKWSEAAQSYLTLCDPMDCSLPGSSLHGILQARVLGWVVISFCRGSSQPRDQTRASCIPGRHFNLWTTREAPGFSKIMLNLLCLCSTNGTTKPGWEHICLQHNLSNILSPLLRHTAQK